MSKVLYYVLSILSILILTPLLTYLFTLKVSNFGGAKGFAFIYLLPIIFLVLFLGWVLERRLFANRIRNYNKKRNIFSIVIIAIGSVIFSQEYIQSQQANKEALHNSYICKNQQSDGFEAYVYEISKNHQTVRFKKSDSSRKSYMYSFKTPQNVLKNSYIGQKVIKKANSIEITFINRLGKEEIITIPCYQ